MQEINLLIVDDEMGIREGTKRVLNNLTVSLPYIEEDYSFTVSTAESGEDALELMNHQQYDIMLLDNKLPGIQGIEVLEYLNSKKYDTVTLMITAYASIETAVAATRTGAYDFLVKPFTPSELEGAVCKAAKHLILTRLTRKLTEEKNKIRFEFISVLAHELKAPLAAVSGYLHLLEERAAGDLLEDYDAIIKRSLFRIEGMRKLIFDLLDLTRIESGEKKRNLALVNIVDVAKSSLENQKTQAEEKEVFLTLSAPDQVLIKADTLEMEMVFNNLISNAVKYNRKKGRAAVTIKENDNMVEIIVSDTGMGITEEEKGQLFREFSRLKNHQNKNISGSGLGLSIVKKIVNLYNGSIKVKSTPGEGSVFSVVMEKNIKL